MDEKDIQYLSLLIMQLHVNINRLETENRALKQQVDEMKKLHEAPSGEEN